MYRLEARGLLAFEVDELWDILTGEFVLCFDDGEIVTNYKETLYSLYSWAFHQKYPKTPLLMKHHVGHFLNERRLGSNTHLELLGSVMWSTHDAYAADPTFNPAELPQLRDTLSEMIYRTMNTMYNELTHRLEENVVSIDITDFMNVMKHPKVKEIKDNIKPTEASIKDAYDRTTEILRNGIDLPDNPLSLAMRSNLVSDSQLMQCLVARGFLTDTDSHQFPHPILRGFAEGLRSFHDSFIESRSAAKSLLFSKAPLQDAEYFSRRLQLMSQVVRTLHHGDCGSTEYNYWNVRPKVVELGETLFGGDLKQLEGKNYLDVDGKLKPIKAGDKHLIGRTLKMRSVLHCAHPDPYGVCSTCFGELSLSVPDKTNLGHMCCTSMTQKSSQSVLSVKHLDGSATIESICLRPGEDKLLAVMPGGSSYMLAEALKGKEAKIVIPERFATNLTDINSVRNVEDLNISRVSEMTEIGIITAFKGVPQPMASIHVGMDHRLASMTYSLLNHIKVVGWDVDDNGNYVVDMADWDWSKPILTLPLKHFNMSDHSKEIADTLESSVVQMKARDKTVSPDAFLVELNDLVNNRLSVNIAVLEVITYATMIVSAENQDYRLPKPGTDRDLGVMEMTMDRRSLSAAMAYEGQYDNFIDPLSFLLRGRPSHPLDAILMPAEVLAYEPI